MSRELFPAIQPAAEQPRQEPLSLCREIAWDFDLGIPIFQDGVPKEVTGKEAVKVWIWKALHAPRYRYDVYTWDYGNELESLIGSGLSEELQRSEAIRYVKEALSISPYIEKVEQIEITMEGDKLKLDCRVTTVYGEVEIYGF